MQHLKDEQQRLKTALTDIRLQLQSQTMRLQWCAWIDSFGCGIQHHNMLDDQQRKRYVEGIVVSVASTPY